MQRIIKRVFMVCSIRMVPPFFKSRTIWTRDGPFGPFQFSARNRARQRRRSDQPSPPGWVRLQVLFSSLNRRASCSLSTLFVKKRKVNLNQETIPFAQTRGFAAGPMGCLPHWFEDRPVVLFAFFVEPEDR